MLDPAALRSSFQQGKPFEAYVATALPSQAPGWASVTARARLTEAQSALVRTFSRRINVLVLSGTWCGDCVQQCPILHAIAQAHPAPASGPPEAPGIDLRLLDRDKHLDLANHFMICGGHRVPAAIFLNEDFDFVSILGDRTLARYRAVAARHLGPSCPLPGAPIAADELAATTSDWLNEFERVALLLRLSPKLRDKHGD
ncbi:MAG: thioredoxin family protein [Chloroflexi bacterium]|nr:thioredoxin family protein [Chloroflexota bacterium]